MKEFRGTPGEFRVYDEHGRFLDAGGWYAENEDESMSSFVPIFAGEKVVALAVMDGFDDSKLGRNARLMAASKDLLEALQYALPSLGFEEAEKARAAIRKALGE